MILLGIGILFWWLSYKSLSNRLLFPFCMDNRKEGKAVVTEDIRIGEKFVLYKDMPDIPGTCWNRFRGPDFDNISKESIRLIDKWGQTGPRILWKKPLGEGHEAPAVYNERNYCFDTTNGRSRMHCVVVVAKGEEFGAGTNKVTEKNSRSFQNIPAVTEKYVVSIGPRGQVMCVDRIKGNLIWGIDLEKEYGSEIPFWYTGQCPLIDHDTAVIAAGGSSLLIGIDCPTGKKLWETPNPRKWKMSHSSIMPMVYKGKKMYVYAAVGGICAVSASGSDVGKILWETTDFSPSVIAPSPLILEDGKILITAGYGAGSAVLQISESGGRYSAKVISKFKPSEGIASEQQTPVLYKGYVYGILPKDAGEMRNQLVCYSPSDFRKALMSSGKTERFGMGPYIVADDKFFILNDDGEMTIARATPSKLTILDKAKIIDGQDSWGPMAITGGYLLMRDSRQLVCIDIKAKRP
jgi:outer membrane protein assembly factor BamB